MALTEGKPKESSAQPPEIPDKLYFRIGEVARLLDLPPYVLRFWETEFPQLKPNKGGTGQRLYRRREVELALRIRGLLYDQGYTIPGARQFLKSEVRSKEKPVPIRPEPVAAPVEDATPASIRLRRIRAELREIATILGRSPEEVPAKRTNPAHRGLHMATSKRRPAAPVTASLFPVHDPLSE